MNLVVYEHITSGALCDEPLTKSLAHEGEMMLSAIVQDLLELGQINITILRDKRLQQAQWIKDSTHLTTKISANRSEFEQHWAQCLKSHTFFLLIAPETDNILLSLQQQVIASNKQYLGCSVEATSQCSDKLHCAQQLFAADVVTPITFSAADSLLDRCLLDQFYVVKPRDGAGCLNTHKFDSIQLTRTFLIALTQNERDKMIVQPYIDGLALSISVYFDQNNIELLSINQQIIEQQTQQFVFHGCVANTIATQQFTEKQAMLLAKQVNQAISGLAGYVGIDFILTKLGPVVVDINPRLTTAYVNLKKNKKYNPSLPLWQHLKRLNQQEAHYA